MYKETTPSLAHVEYLYTPSSTWNTGRNLLFITAMNKSAKYLYYIFMDDDIILKLDSGDENPWRVFETFLLEIEPAVGVVDINPHGKLRRVYKGREQQQCSINESTDYLPIAHFDAALNAFHYKAVQHILPYTLKFDNICWWFSGWSVMIKSEVMFAGQVVVHTKLTALNHKHRPYPRQRSLTINGTDYWPQIVKEASRSLPQMYQNVHLLLEWIEQGPRHTIQSTALCLPPLKPHMLIKPFSFLEQNVNAGNGIVSIAISVNYEL